MKEHLKKFNGVTILFVLLAFFLGWQLGHRDVKVQWDNYKPSFNLTSQSPPQDKQNLDFKLFWDTWDLVSREYVDKKAVDPQKMFYGAIQGMVAAVGDPYTYFLPPETQKATKEELGGSFDGVGIQLGFNKENHLVVMAPLQDTPAWKAGIKAGDLIVKINNKDTTGMTLADAVKLIRGPKGTKVELELYHEGDSKTKTETLERDTIVVKSVEYSQKTTPKNKKVGVLKLTRFGERTNVEWNEAVSNTLSDGDQAVILDLRNNPGGFLEGAVYIGSEFISTGNIVQQENAQGEKQGYKVSRVGKLLSLPMVVLINKGSASASEIVAGAIQDNKRGKLIGDQSFGKGTIQESEDLPGGTGIHITTAKWLTPLGRWIHNLGLTPDIKIIPTDEELKDTTKDVQMEKALETIDQL